MRIAVLADIHGNVSALRAVLNRLRQRGADLICVLGDLVGYYYEPQAVWDELSAWPTCMIRGNHEDLLFRGVAEPALFEQLGAKYGSAHKRASTQLAPSVLTALSELPANRWLDIEGRRVYLCHGSPRDPDEYVYPDADPTAWRSFESTGADLVLFGHTHYSFKRLAGSSLAINPGSVGQPRDRRRGAAWAMIQFPAMEVELNREDYDCSQVLSQIGRFDPAMPYLATVLTR